MEFFEFVAGIALFAIAAVIGGVLGFGGGLIAVPFLVLVNPEFIPIPMLFTAIIFSGMVAWRERMMISPSAVKWALVGIIPGVALGVFILLAISTEILGVFISLLLLVFVGIQVTRFHLKQTSKTILIGGFLGGIMSNTVGMPGVALALTMSKFEGPTFRSTINACVVMISVISSVVLIVAGEVATSHLKLASYTLIGALIGFKISGPLRHLVDRKGITEITYAISALGSMILLIRSVI